MPPSNKTSATPKNWPPHVPYLTAPIYSKTLSSEDRASLRIPPQSTLNSSPASSISETPSLVPTDIPKGPCQSVRITPITAPTHPAYGQGGLFATRDLKSGTFILQYLGEVHGRVDAPSSLHTSSASRTSVTATPHKASAHEKSDYDLSLDRERGIGIDAASTSNEARFINDYRGVAARPNAEFREIWDLRRKEKGMAVYVLPEGGVRLKSRSEGKGIEKGSRSRGIRRGEEILVSYGKGFWEARRGAGGDEVFDVNDDGQLK